MPPKTVALTFDDGPDPEWTPQMLAVLAQLPRARDVLRRRLPGGALPRPGAGDPGLRLRDRPAHLHPSRAARGLADPGRPEFTAPARPGRRDRAAELPIRPPYSSEASAVDNAGYGVMQRLGQEGYVTALVDVDSNDWQLPGVDAIVDAVLPAGHHRWRGAAARRRAAIARRPSRRSTGSSRSCRPGRHVHHRHRRRRPTRRPTSRPARPTGDGDGHARRGGCGRRRSSRRWSGAC